MRNMRKLARDRALLGQVTTPTSTLEDDDATSTISQTSRASTRRALRDQTTLLRVSVDLSGAEAQPARSIVDATGATYTTGREQRRSQQRLVSRACGTRESCDRDARRIVAEMMREASAWSPEVRAQAADQVRRSAAAMTMSATTRAWMLKRAAELEQL